MRRLSSPNMLLMKLFSFAIWDRSKVIIAISAAICVINLGIQLIGKLTSLYAPVNPNLNEYDLNSGIVKVNDRFQSFVALLPYSSPDSRRMVA